MSSMHVKQAYKRRGLRFWSCALILSLILGLFPAAPAVHADSAHPDAATLTSPVFGLDEAGTVTATVYRVTDSNVTKQYINGNFSGWSFTAMTQGDQVSDQGVSKNTFYYTFTTAQLQAQGCSVEYKFMPEQSWDVSLVDPLNPSKTSGGNSLVSAMALSAASDTAAPGSTVQISAARKLADGTSKDLTDLAVWSSDTSSVTVDKGRVTIPAGTASGTVVKISAAYEGLTLTKNLTVLSGEVKSPVINKEDGTVTFNNISSPGPEVYLAGQMNGWSSSAAKMTKKNGVYTVTLPLSAGTYEYKFVTVKADKTQDWFTDPLNSKSSNGNSVVYVPGIKITSDANIVKGKSLDLTALLVSGTDGSSSALTPTWELAEPKEGVTLSGSTLSVAANYSGGNKVTVTATSGDYTASQTITVLDKMYTFNLHYYRDKQNYSGWDNWIWGPGVDGKAYAFTGTDTDGFATVSVTLPIDTISILPRLGGDAWTQKDAEHGNVQIPAGATAADVWLVQNDNKAYFNREAALAAKDAIPAPRYAEVHYKRPAKDYEGWNLHVWSTGAAGGDIPFEYTPGSDYAVARVEIGSRTDKFGFKIHHGKEWEQIDIDYDREISTPLDLTVTKVEITQGVGAIRTIPSVNGPVLEDGGITFYYRNNELYNQGRMNELTAASVRVKLNGQTAEYPMVYDSANEYFTYTLPNLQEGDYTYSFLVTQKDKGTSEIVDPKNNAGGVSAFAYRKPSGTVNASLAPAAISPNENTVLTVTYQLENNTAVRSLSVDLTPVGGPAKFAIDPELLQGTIAVTDSTGAGDKTLLVTAVDVYGNKHTTQASLTVKPRVNAGSLDFDWDEARIYFLLTDRFQDGDAGNNANVDKTKINAYHGGDFKGLTGKLDYIKDLGINTIWITPIVDNIDFNVSGDGGTSYGYHGYWTKNFEALEEHLGNMDDFKTLINSAHDKGIKIMVDVVLNHAGYDLKETSTNPNVTQEDKDRFKGMLRTDGVSSDQDVVKGELSGLPDFKTEDPAVRAKLIDWQAGWLQRAKTERGDTIDYFRVDTVKHVDDTTWKAFKNALTAIDPDFKMIGEQFGASINADGGKLKTGEMDALLDFEFNANADNLIKGKIDQAETYLEQRNELLNNTATMGNFLSSHDEDGFLATSAGGDKDLLKVAAAMQMTVKGQPVVYYGEELGLSGVAKDNLNRYDMDWSRVDTEKDLLNHYKKLLNLRAEYSKVFAKGTHTKVAGGSADGYLVYNRAYTSGGTTTNLYVGLNPTNKEATATFAVPYTAGSVLTDKYNGVDYTVGPDRKISVKLPARTQGGTAVIALTKEAADSSATPAPAATPAPSASAAAVAVSAAQLQAAGDKVSLDLGAMTAGVKKQITLPANAGTLTGGRPVELKTAELALTLPGQVLSDLQALVPASGLAGAQISLTVTKQAAGSLDGALAKASAAEGASLRAAGGIYSFELAAVLADGTAKKLERFARPVTLTLPVNAGANADLVGVYYIPASGQPEYAGGQTSAATVTANVYHFSTYAALEYDKTFTDVKPTHWAYGNIRTMAAKHIVQGKNAAQFDPSGQVTRAEFAAMLVRGLGLEGKTGTASPFRDVPAGSWYLSSVLAAYDAKLIQGTDAAHFSPSKAISRQEMASMLVRALALKGISVPAGGSAASAYSDAASISGWALDAMNTAVASGLMSGKSALRLDPQAQSTRAEAAAVLARLLAK